MLAIAKLLVVLTVVIATQFVFKSPKNVTVRYVFAVVFDPFVCYCSKCDE